MPPRRHRRWLVGIAALLSLGAVGSVLAVLIAPDTVQRLVRGESCPGGVSDPDAEPAPSAPVLPAAQEAPVPARPDHDVDSVAVVDGARIPALWPFTTASPWNMPIGNQARYTAPDDARLQHLRRARAYVNIDEFSIQIFEATASDPLEQVEAIANEASLEMYIPVHAEPSRGSDRNLDVVQPDGVTLWEHWIMTGGPGAWRSQYAVSVRLDGDGISGGVRAYGGSTAAGLVREFELEEGEIRHALALALCATQLRNGPVWPATTEDGGGTDTGDYSGLIPLGTLMAIPPSVDIDELDLSPAGAAIARAYQRYGGYVTDSAGSAVVAFVEPSTPAELRPSSRDAARILDALRIVENNSATAVGGPGVRLAPLAPPISSP
jgi:hypothetical protein